MAAYTLHFVNPTLGYFEREEAFDAVNDEVAIGIVRRRAGSQPLELWSGGRLIERVPALPLIATPMATEQIPSTRIPASS